MHGSDWNVGMLGANSIIGASAPHALGAAFTAKYKHTGGVAIAFGGDGASNQGAVFESMNFAKAYKLPVIFVLEDNGYAESTYKSYTTAGDPSSRVTGFGIPSVSLDGADFFAVAEAAREAIERARAGGGPSFIHCQVPLFFAHFEGDQESNLRNLTLLRQRRTDIHSALGPGVALEEWDKGWTRVHEIVPLEPLTMDFLVDVSFRLSKMIKTLEPLLRAGGGRGLEQRQHSGYTLRHQ